MLKIKVKFQALATAQGVDLGEGLCNIPKVEQERVIWYLKLSAKTCEPAALILSRCAIQLKVMVVLRSHFRL